MSNVDLLKATHVSDTGREPVLAEPGSVVETKADTDKVQAQEVDHKLDVLAKDYYLFSVAPVYYVTGFPHDIIRQFMNEVGTADAHCISFVSKDSHPVFYGKDQWCHVIQGLPWSLVRSTMDSNNNLFKAYVLTMEIDQLPSEGKQRRYWAINREIVRICTPGVVSSVVPIDVYVPTGCDYSVSTVVQANGEIGFVKLPPDPKIRARALEFYSQEGK